MRQAKIIHESRCVATGDPADFFRGHYLPRRELSTWFICPHVLIRTTVAISGLAVIRMEAGRLLRKNHEKLKVPGALTI